MISRIFSNNRIARITCVVLLSFLSTEALAETTDSSAGLTNFAFANYLGSGFYTTSGQKVFVLQIPLDHTIREMADDQAGIVLNLPLTIGFVNFKGLDILDEQGISTQSIDPPGLPSINDATTLTFLPGIEYQHPVTKDWTVIPFADYGFARDFNNKQNILVIGFGVKSYYDFPLGDATVTLGNRFLHASERAKSLAINSSYSVIETGLNYRVNSDYEFENGALQSNLYYINLYYPNDVEFLQQTTQPIRVGVENEVGITFSNIPDFLFFEKPELGIGIRVGNDITAYRIIFGAPF